MRAQEFICEIERRLTSFDEIVHTIQTAIGSQLLTLYRDLKVNLQNHFARSGTVKGFSSGLTTSKWMYEFKHNTRENLKQLTRIKYFNNINAKQPLAAFLETRAKSEELKFGVVSNELPELLIDLIDESETRKLPQDVEDKLESLRGMVDEWVRMRTEYKKLYNELKAKEEGEIAPKQPKVPVQATPKEKQISTGTELIDPIIKKLPKHIRDKIDINSIRRSGDQFSALMMALRPFMKELQQANFQIESLNEDFDLSNLFKSFDD